ncbi:hypothetical protein SAMN04488058_1385 [Deinococcus reticulitermitis]|uniref:Uncharacterized protein n=1 Tax=Deinococcus reticulitermitis TaxID=856736 RepID=A0A1H7CS35_9DEIO|nr:hypothetical protein SAMN04488058_1385 [Deinococcus reticulitermitis]
MPVRAASEAAREQVQRAAAYRLIYAGGVRPAYGEAGGARRGCRWKAVGDRRLWASDRGFAQTGALRSRAMKKPSTPPTGTVSTPAPA